MYFPVNFAKSLRAPFLQNSSSGCFWNLPGFSGFGNIYFNIKETSKKKKKVLKKKKLLHFSLEVLNKSKRMEEKEVIDLKGGCLLNSGQALFL